MNISERLKIIASFIKKDSVLADIGTDHAYLPIYALKQGSIHRAICGDVSKGPLRMAQKHVREKGLEDKIALRLGDGLDVIRPDDRVDCVTICGMGGFLISEILDEGKERLLPVKRLILQPNNGEELVRRWLMENNWELISERILEEEGHIYEILVAEPGDGKKPYTCLEKELLFGPFLLKEKNRIFRMKWEREKIAMQQVLKQLEQAIETPEILKKMESFRKKIRWIEEVLADDKRV